MKNYLFILAFIFSAICFAQDGSAFGVRAGLNYGATGDYQRDSQNVRENPDANVGYHLGLFAKVDAGPIYIRPELLYMRIVNDYSDSRLNLDTIKMPFLLGVNVVGPLNIYAGPSFQYILESDLTKNERLGDAFDFDKIEDQFTIGAQFGVSVYFSNLEVGLRYDRRFSDNVATFAVNNGIDNVRVDTRNEQFILALSLQL